MKTYFAYVRVSTARQSQGTSLAEQRFAIEQYAETHNLPITLWFEEVQTAAKSGRSVFQSMIRELRRKRGTGLILHKIDRGARNLWDWALLGQLIDAGVDIRFVHDNFDLGTRGGRLAADLQAVIAADYIRNLKEEARKGFLGRLRQGLYPLPAPRGYLDRGPGKAKVPDPFVAPLIIYAFEAYATGQWSLRNLCADLFRRGLETRDGKALRPGALSRIFRQPFYCGAILHQGQQYPGCHQPLIERRMFDQAQRLLRSRAHRSRTARQFHYQRRFRCVPCGFSIVGETHKGHTYYRCHHCRYGIREEVLMDAEQKERGTLVRVSGHQLSRTIPYLSPVSRFEVHERPQRSSIFNEKSLPNVA